MILNNIHEQTLCQIAVTDYGVGFTKEEQVSFNTLDSLHNSNYGCKGSGRFSILRAFNIIKIDSVIGNIRYEFELGEQYYDDKNNVEGLSKMKSTALQNLDRKTTVTAIYKNEHKKIIHITLNKQDLITDSDIEKIACNKEFRLNDYNFKIYCFETQIVDATTNESKNKKYYFKSE